MSQENSCMWCGDHFFIRLGCCDICDGRVQCLAGNVCAFTYFCEHCIQTWGAADLLGYFQRNADGSFNSKM